jgi:mono/diheme cytochrome c family protein
MRRLFVILVALGVIGLVVFWIVTTPHPRDMAPYAGLTGDAVHGEQVFWATGCASCHMADKASGEAKLVLSGGQSFATAFGTFLAPNISPDPAAGIGGWSLDQFVHAVQDGITPGGAHEFPAMPYLAYAKMLPQDVVDLKAFMDGLPPSPTASQPHQVGFPFNIRRALGGWKFLFGATDYVLQGELTPEVARGRYIAEAMAHCGECHTPRNALGGLSKGQWLGGAALPDGKGRTPNITPGKLTWTEDEIFAYLTTGFTPDFDSVGGPMAHVVDNMARLPEADVKAVVAYLKAVPAVP